jgi:hypothetical protein
LALLSPFPRRPAHLYLDAALFVPPKHFKNIPKIVGVKKVCAALQAVFALAGVVNVCLYQHERNVSLNSSV